MLEKTEERKGLRLPNRLSGRCLEAQSNRFLTIDPRTLPKQGSKIKAAALCLFLFNCGVAHGQAHRNLPNAVLVEPQKFADEKAVLKWEVRSPELSYLVTAYDMDGRKKWSLRASGGRLTLGREREAFEVLVTPVQTGIKAPDWVALEDPAKSSGATGAVVVVARPPSSVWVSPTPAVKPQVVESSQPASIYLGPSAVTPTPVKPKTDVAAVASTPFPVKTLTPAKIAPTPVAVAAQPTPAMTPVVSAPKPSDTYAGDMPVTEEKPTKGGIFGVLGGVGRGLLSLTRADLDVTTSGPQQAAAVAAMFPFGGWGVQTLWFQGYRLSQPADYQAAGTKGSADVNFTGALADISLSFNLAALAGITPQFFFGVGPLIASSQSPGLPADYEQSVVPLPTVEKTSRIGAGGTLLIGWRGKTVVTYLQGNYETDAADAGQTLVGRALMSFRIAGPFSALLGATVDEERLSLCRGTEDHCKTKGNTRIRLTQANAMMGIGASW